MTLNGNFYLKKFNYLQYFLRSFRGTGPWTRPTLTISPYWPSKGLLSVLGQLTSKQSLVLGPTLCPGDGAAKRPQEMPY